MTPGSAQGVGNPPTWFGESEAAAWREVVGLVPDLQAIDRHLLTVLSASLSLYRAACVDARQHDVAKQIMDETASAIVGVATSLRLSSRAVTALLDFTSSEDSQHVD